MASTVISRRVFALRVAAIPMALGATDWGFAAPGPMEPYAASGASGVSHAAAAIRQEVLLDAGRHRVYQALTTAERFDKVVRLSAAAAFATMPDAPPTQIAPIEGGAFALFGGYVTGQQVELVPDERIVQVWRARSWEPGAYSVARFVLKDEGTKTRLVLDHKGFPDDQATHLADGWQVNYWQPLAQYLSQG